MTAAGGKMRARLGPILFWTALTLPLRSIFAENTTAPLPDWLNKAIVERRDSRSREVIEESTYNGERAYLFTRGDRADTGDEHILYNKGGKLLCQFGGLAGNIITAGACDIEKIVYVRTLYPAKAQ
jgi:hypothetical protein